MWNYCSLISQGCWDMTWWEGVKDGDRLLIVVLVSGGGEGGGGGGESIEDWLKTMKPCCWSQHKKGALRQIIPSSGEAYRRAGLGLLPCRPTGPGRGGEGGTKRWSDGNWTICHSSNSHPSLEVRGRGRRGHPPNFWHIRSQEEGCRPHIWTHRTTFTS